MAIGLSGARWKPGPMHPELRPRARGAVVPRYGSGKSATTDRGTFGSTTLAPLHPYGKREPGAGRGRHGNPWPGCRWSRFERAGIAVRRNGARRQRSGSRPWPTGRPRVNDLPAIGQLDRPATPVPRLSRAAGHDRPAAHDGWAAALSATGGLSVVTRPPRGLRRPTRCTPVPLFCGFPVNEPCWAGRLVTRHRQRTGHRA